MKKCILLLCVGLSVLGLKAQTLVHYWNFNNNTSETALLTPAISQVGGASISHIQGPNSLIDVAGGTGQNFNINNYNARNGDVSGTHLRFNSPIGGVLEFALPTTGYKDASVKFATRRSSTGAAAEQYWYYSLDGINFIFFDTIFPNAGDPTLETLDFDGITGSDNNPNFKLRVEFGNGGPTTGNNRFDNFTLDGTPFITPALVHYWNFNDNTNQTNLITSNIDLVGGNGIQHIQGPNSLIDVAGGTGQNFNINNFNARNGDVSGTHLRFNSPIGGALEFSLPTTGYKDPIIKFSTRRSSTGAAAEQYWYYSLDGTTFLFFDTLFPFAGDPTLETLNFDAISAADNNPNFKLRVEFGNGGPTTGNNRFDNFTLDADPLSGQDLIPPTALFSPANGSVNVPVNVQPTITFNEPVRLIYNTPLNNSNVDAIVELRLNNASGALVPFDATISGNIITITPSATLQNNQTYYVAVLENTVEDFSDNALASTLSASFTTISLQTQFQPSDVLLVAYRMNATGADDEIAFLTFVDILPGTQIQFTDAKYTSNAQPQCAGGFTWTAPANDCIAAGSVIKITTSPLSTNRGTVSGGSFGLSSGGDQVIVYTGTAANPNYITALSSNDWVTSNTTCGGSLSLIPAGLSNGINAITLTNAPGNDAGNSANAYYNGITSGVTAQIKSAILDPQNWVVSASGTAPQVWPAWNFPGPPSVVNAQVLNQTTLRLIYNTDLVISTAQNTANYTGIPNLASAVCTNNGSAPDTVLLTFSAPFAQATNYTLVVSDVQNTLGFTMLCPYQFSFSYNTQISFANAFISRSEGDGSVVININVVNPADATAELVLKPAPFSNINSSDISFSGTMVNITGATVSPVQITIPITDDSEEEQDEYFVLELQNIQGAALSGSSFITVYIRDNDRQAPVGTQEVELVHVSSFDPVVGSSTTEIVAHDPVSQRIFLTSSVQNRFDIADFSDPANIALIGSVNMAPYGGITSLAVKNGVLAVACPNANEQLNGSVVFFDTNGNFLNQVTVGALPDMVCFTPDGQKVLTANEGQPNDAYTVDPEGSVSIIDISGGIAGLSQANVKTKLFTHFNAQESALIASGVRKLKLSSTLSQDFEPEYISVSPNSQTAWVTIQENNALAVIDLNTDSIVSVHALGTKDYNAFGNGFDASDNSGVVHLSNWPVKAFYIPDAIANYTVGGVTYLVTANEGDEKEYGGLNERTTVSDVTLDPMAFPHSTFLKQSHNLGRLRITNRNGDNDGDGDYDELYVVGSRSFSIWDASTMTLVYDSGDDMELITSKHPVFGPLFNASHDNNSFKNRSRAKGPEPEGVTIAKVGNSTFAFIALERIGGLMIYNITDPLNPVFVDYKNTRTVSPLGGDLGPETVVYVSPDESPDGEHYLLVTNEISGTVTVFKLNYAAPQFALGQDTTICGGSSVTLNAPAGFNYQWSTGESTSSVSVSQSGPVWVNVIAQNGNTSTDTLQVTVLSVPSVNQQPDQTICNGAPTSDITFTGSASGFSWTNNNPSVGLSSSGSGNIPPFIGINNNNTVSTAQISVTPQVSQNGVNCPGPSQSFNIKINPTPNTTIPATQVACPGETIGGFNLSGSVAGTAYSWTNDNTSIGLQALGTGNIMPFAATNSTPAQISGSVTITPAFTADGVTCSGTIQQFIIIVNPTPPVSFTGLDSEYNLNDPEVTLIPTPSGGIFSGPGIVNGNQFLPSTAGEGGPYVISYSYTSPNTGCTAVAESTVTVLPVDYTSVEESTAAAYISVYPNPAVDQVFVSVIIQGSDKLMLKMTDIQGRSVLNTSINGLAPGLYTFNIDRHQYNLASGTYMLSLINGHQMFVEKIILK